MNSPVYQQIAGVLKRRITSGQYVEGDQIPALEDLLDEFSVSRMTMVKSLDLLDAQGLLKRQRGRGTFVGPVPKNIHTVIDQTADEIELEGNGRTSILTDCHTWIGKPPEIEGTFIAPESYQYLARTMFSKNQPYHTAEYFLDSDVYASRDEKFWQKQTMARALFAIDEMFPVSVRQIIKVDNADLTEAKSLKIELNDAVLHARRIFTQKHTGRVVCLALLTFRADLVRFDTTIECDSESALENIRGQVLEN